MSDFFTDLSDSGTIPGYDIELPKENVKHYLITEGIVKSISRPERFRRGIIAVVKSRKNELIILIKTAKAFGDIQKMFLEDSVEWLLIIKWKKGYILALFLVFENIV